MRSVRIEPTRRGTLLIDVVCDCGNNGLKNLITRESSFKHPVTIGGGTTIILVCKCKKRYILCPQGDHIHVSEEQKQEEE